MSKPERCRYERRDRCARAVYGRQHEDPSPDAIRAGLPAMSRRTPTIPTRPATPGGGRTTPTRRAQAECRPVRTEDGSIQATRPWPGPAFRNDP
jgi:hypothetical protein